MFPQKFPHALLIQNFMILVAILCVLAMTGNALSLMGVVFMRPIPVIDLAAAIVQQREEYAQQLAEEEADDEEHQVREVGFNAKHDE